MLYETGYNLSAFVISLVGFLVVLIDLVLGVALSIFIGGILLVSVGIIVSRGFARFERIRIRGMLGRDAATPRSPLPKPGDGFWRRQPPPQGRAVVA